MTLKWEIPASCGLFFSFGFPFNASRESSATLMLMTATISVETVKLTQDQSVFATILICSHSCLQTGSCDKLLTHDQSSIIVIASLLH